MIFPFPTIIYCRNNIFRSRFRCEFNIFEIKIRNTNFSTLHVREILLSGDANSRFVVIFIRRGRSRGFVRAKRLSIQETRARGRILWIPLTNSALSPNSNKRGRGYKLRSAIFARPTAFWLSRFVPKKRKKKRRRRRRRRSFHPRKFIKVEKDLDDSSLHLPEGVNYAQSGREVLNFERCDVSSDANKERGESSLCIRFPDV